MDLQRLKIRWENLIAPYAVADQESERLFREICTFYSSPGRHFHTLQHLEHLFCELDESGCHDEACQWATWYHDIIFTPNRLNNEDLSAEFCIRSLKIIRVPEYLRQRAAAMIGATRTHLVARDEEEALFLDADMAILGAPKTKYDAYCEKIALEFASLPKPIFVARRKSLIHGWLGRESIYLTERIRAKYECRARRNLENELFQLEKITNSEQGGHF